MDERTLALLIPVAFLVIFPLFWCFVVWFISLLAGWQALASRYRTDLPRPAGTRTMVSARLGWARYNNVLAVGFAPDGLHLDIFPLFRPGHAPLRIPWKDVADSGETTGLFFKFSVLHLGPDRTRLLLPEALWTQRPATPNA